MDDTETGEEVLRKAASETGVDLSAFQVELFRVYMAELMTWNRRVNLTALRTERDIVLKHFVDSLTPLSLIPEGSRILDIGSGAGFPGIPLKIVEPSFCLLLVDAKRKKVHFLKHIIRTLGLTGITAEQVHLDSRVAGSPHFREKADVVISRAFSDLCSFLDLSFLLLRPGGLAIAMKGKNVQRELETAFSGDACRNGRFAPAGHLEIKLPIIGAERHLMVYRKK